MFPALSDLEWFHQPDAEICRKLESLAFKFKDVRNIEAPWVVTKTPEGKWDTFLIEEIPPKTFHAYEPPEYIHNITIGG